MDKVKFLSEEAEKNFEEVCKNKYRLKFHLMPLVGGLCDPNAMLYHKGEYHFHYIYSPSDFYKKKVANVWGHYKTKDFINYEILPISIYPSIEKDRDGIYSGSAIIEDNKNIIFYTGNVKQKGNFDYIYEGREQNIIKIESLDGIKFDVQTKKVLLTNEDFPKNLTKHVRDPKVFKIDKEFFMLLGARDNKNKGLILLYKSKNLENWELVNQIYDNIMGSYMLECPDIQFYESTYLIFCPQRFENDDFLNRHLCGYSKISDLKNTKEIKEFIPFDYGFDFYAARTLKDEKNRTILIGWMGVSEAPHTEIDETVGWHHAMTLPRELIEKEGKLLQKPLEEYKKLRLNKKEYFIENILELDILTYEMIMRNRNQSFEIFFKESAILKYFNGELSLRFLEGKRDIRKVCLNKLEKLQIFVDKCSIEIFINDGIMTMTTYIFSDIDKLRIKGKNLEVEFYEMGEFKYLDRRY